MSTVAMSVLGFPGSWGQLSMWLRPQSCVQAAFSKDGTWRRAMPSPSRAQDPCDGWSSLWSPAAWQDHKRSSSYLVLPFLPLSWGSSQQCDLRAMLTCSWVLHRCPQSSFCKSSFWCLLLGTRTDNRKLLQKCNSIYTLPLLQPRPLLHKPEKPRNYCCFRQLIFSDIYTHYLSFLWPFFPFLFAVLFSSLEIFLQSEELTLVFPEVWVCWRRILFALVFLKTSYIFPSLWKDSCI